MSNKVIQITTWELSDDDFDYFKQDATHVLEHVAPVTEVLYVDAEEVMEDE